MSVLKLEKVSKIVKGEQKLSNVNINIEEGDFYGVIGGEGSGKRTILKIIMDFLRPDTGKVIIFDLDNTRYSYKIKNDIECVFANPEFLNITVRDLLVKYSKKKFLDIFELENLFAEYNIKLSQKINTLSFKQKKFVFLIRAIFLNPKFLILEQPFSGIDSRMANVIKSYLIDLNKNGTTILIIDENSTNIENLCTKMSFIHNGVIVENLNNCNVLRNMKIVTLTTDENIAPMLMILQAQNVNIQNNVYRFNYDGAISLLIKLLNQYEIKDINIYDALNSKVLYKY